MKFYFDKRILIGFFSALAILSWLAFSSYLNTKELDRSTELVIHTMDVLYNTEHMMAVATNIELGQRGYTITGDEAFLNTYRKANHEIDGRIEDLKLLLNDNPAQRNRILELQEKIKLLIVFSSETVGARDKEGFDAARAMNSTLRGKMLLDSVRMLVGKIKAEENTLLHNRTSASEQQLEKFNFAFIALLTATGLIIIGIFYAVNHNLGVRLETETKLKTAADEIRDLYDNAPCGYHSLDEKGYFVNVNNTFCDWIGYQKEELIHQLRFDDIISEHDKELFSRSFSKFKKAGEIYDLEFYLKRKDGTEFPVILSALAIKDDEGRFVKSRSITINIAERKSAETKVKNLNHELEAFTYSVSHDLRAPLRSIDGYARILQEDYGDKLDNEGKRVLNVVMNNAKRMGKLIDDLLDFARLGRKDIVRSNVSMNMIVNSIIKDLMEQENDRNVTFEVEKLFDAPVDVDMIRQAWENLLSNAVKYTGKNANPVVQVRSRRDGNEVVYSVSDNGVGFDMSYVGKLFGVFQRLHKVQEFMGTGVGLAIVKRIIDRHGGRVWAEAEVNKGASFYFTIPNDNGKS